MTNNSKKDEKTIDDYKSIIKFLFSALDEVCGALKQLWLCCINEDEKTVPSSKYIIIEIAKYIANLKSTHAQEIMDQSNDYQEIFHEYVKMMSMYNDAFKNYKRVLSKIKHYCENIKENPVKNITAYKIYNMVKDFKCIK